jgi:NAD(P)-dependent dehydrogenase (short-subunit alcohol dehydrogenase family)
VKVEPGQVAVVTGAASGIGAALARACWRRGMRVVLADVRAAQLKDVARALAAEGADVLTVPTDVTDAAAVKALADATFGHYGRADLVCNNAGVVGPQRPMWEQGPEVWRWLLDVALMGVVHGVHAFVPHLVARGSGHVLNTASVGGLIRLPTLAPYGAAKHAVVALTETLREELRLFAPGVGATVLCPGYVDTSLAASSEQNRPQAVESGRMPHPITETRNNGITLTADQVAAAALAGVENDRAHIITHPDSVGPVRERIDALLADLP